MKHSMLPFEDEGENGTPHDALGMGPLPQLTFRATCTALQRAVAQLREAIGCLQQHHSRLPMAGSAAPSINCRGC